MLFFAAEDRNKRALLAFVLGTLVIGIGASIFTTPNIEGWYAGLNKPEFNPPNWIFAPVWTTLYIMMAVAAWRVWKVTGLNSKELKLYGAQLALNFAWSFLFFSAHRVDWAFYDIFALWVLILATSKAFHKRDTVAGLLFLPYLAWVGFAMALNYAILQLNPIP